MKQRIITRLTANLRVGAITTSNRIAATPDVPAIAESGIKGCDVIPWHGLIAPKGFPR